MISHITGCRLFSREKDKKNICTYRLDPEILCYLNNQYMCNGEFGSLFDCCYRCFSTSCQYLVAVSPLTA